MQLPLGINLPERKGHQTVGAAAAGVQRMRRGRARILHLSRHLYHVQWRGQDHLSAGQDHQRAS